MFSKIYRPLFLITVSFLATLLLCQLISGDCVLCFFEDTKNENNIEDNRELETEDFKGVKKEESKNENEKTDSIKPWEQNWEEKKPVTAFEQVKADSLKLVEQGYLPKNIKNGDEPDCSNYSPEYKRDLDNKLEVEVGGGTDVAIKLMEKGTDKCIRYFFVNSRTTYAIKNIPEGRYYLKIAYGKRWMMTSQDGECKGKFLKNPSYEKGDDILDFNVQHKGDHISIPYFKISLDVIETSAVNSFDTQKISEEQFNQ